MCIIITLTENYPEKIAPLKPKRNFFFNNKQKNLSKYARLSFFLIFFHAQVLSFSLGGAVAVAADTIGMESLFPFPLNKLFSAGLLLSSSLRAPLSASRTSARRAASV